MISVGLTGNIASGKTTVANLFAGWGATVIDADTLTREVQSVGSPVLDAIRDRFGADVFQQDGGLDRRALRRAVMSDEAALASLNAIVHPAVSRRRAEYLGRAEAEGDLVVVNDIPLLFEVLDPSAFDLVVLVDAPEQTRRARLVGRRGLSAEEADRMMEAQLPSGPKRRDSHFVVDNAGSLDDLEAAAWQVWREIRREAATRTAPEGGRLLAVIANPDDAAHSLGGTLARYADGGVEVAVWCATDGQTGARTYHPADREDARERGRRELQSAAKILGVARVQHGGFAGGMLDPEDSAAIAAVAALLADFRPDVIVTLGSAGAAAHPDHGVVRALVTRAWSDAGRPGKMFYLTPTAATAIPGRSDRPGGGQPAMAARVDVRPWRDLKKGAIATHGSQRRFDALEDAILDREWFTSPEPGAEPSAGLFDQLDRA